MINFVLGMLTGATALFVVSCVINHPMYTAACKHLALSKKMLDEQQRIFQRVQQKLDTGRCSCGHCDCAS